MTSHVLTPDTQAILLLCGSLGQSRAREAPLTQGEYNQVAQWLQREQLRPADLLQPEGLNRVQAAGATLPLGRRVEGLVSRGGALALAVESWTNKGLWIISRSDPDYPRALRSRLGRQAPPILYGVGERLLLEQGGLAIVGSRDADEGGLDFARSAALACSRQGVPVISGGARGVDSTAMDAAIESEGVVIGVLADSLARAAVTRKYRTAIREGLLVFVSPFDPDAGFNTGNAMNRNKAIYALSDLALVVSATLEKGGTWNGATENLKHGWVPLFVRNETPQLAGNRRLIELGGYSVDRGVLDRRVSVDDWLDGRELASNMGLPLQPTMAISEAVPIQTEEDAALNTQSLAELPAVAEGFPATNIEAESSLTSSEIAEATSQLVEKLKQQPVVTNGDEYDLFGIVWPYLKQALATPRTDREVAELFQLELKQAQTWLRRAIEQGSLKKLQKPVRYVATNSTLQPLPLFDQNDYQGNAAS
ncbi:DNA-protecting protein DprA [Candidatus Chloroploca sp. M-50]|uniref:DNA-protecting protein DprA n=1 Tax=Candidatus Chloroploca mongolica TaxID=2528176 RepID=A0ABS4D4L6_9CHLR|nr:DNA-processing protein DprA [Candidatus Chloroploca mongolica]MBP1464381.1 DNA-protecting protein DprA [Candidatus Chloroploca mongolica]